MPTDFTAEFFRHNREKLRTLFTGKAPIVLTAHGLLQRNGDSEYKFRQDSSFWYLTGVDEPDILLVMDKSRDYLIVPERDSVAEAFNGRLDFKKFKDISGVAEVLDEKSGWKRLSQRLKKVRHVATLAPPPAYTERMGLYTNPARARLVARIREANPEAELLDLRQHLSRMRAVKQDIELSAIQTAIDITIDTLKPIARKLQKYSYEYQVEADITHGFRSRGAQGHAFFPIVAGGDSTCTLHYEANDQPLANARLIYLDVGAEYGHYAADITRTYFLKEPTKRERKVYQAVVDVHQYAAELMKPGVLIKQNEIKIEQFMGEKLRELGLIRLIDKESVRKYFPHATSHSLGLDPHDAMDYDQPLEPGMVLTVEPGIYIPEEGIGVRIEDDLLVTEQGMQSLSHKLPVPAV